MYLWKQIKTQTPQRDKFRLTTTRLSKSGRKAINSPLGVPATCCLWRRAGLILLQYVIAMASNPDIINVIDIGIAVFFVGSFLALAFWTKKKPYTAIVGGIVVFALFVLFQVLLRAYLEGATGAAKGLFGGWLFKIIMLVALIKPLKDAKELQEMMEQKI
jgi:hypothetical protein